MTRSQPHLPDILRLADANVPVAEIASQVPLCASRIYGILREHRPDRTRKPRRRTSNVPAKIAALAAMGSSVERVCKLLGKSRAYVYRCWPREGTEG